MIQDQRIATDSDGNLDVTVCFVPRETVSSTIRNLDRLIAHVDGARIVAVDPGYPAEVGTELFRRVQAAGGSVVRFDGFITPNQARNAALQHVKTKYVVFVDNDATVEDGWLLPLVECARATGAVIVTPLIFERFPQFRYIHLAGGECGLTVNSRGLREMKDRHTLSGHDIVAEPLALEAGPTELAEFHAVLVDVAFLRSIGGLDPNLLSLHEHWDMCMQAHLRGLSVWFEPRSRVTYTPPMPANDDDLAYFELRWCDEFTERSLNHLIEKYDLDPTHHTLHALRKFVRNHQTHRLARVRSSLRRVLGPKWSHRIVRDVVNPAVKQMRRRELKTSLKRWENRTV